MTTTTHPTPAPQRKTLLRALNACIETCMDGEKGFAMAAAEVRDPALKGLLMRRSRQRGEHKAALQSAIAALGGFPENEGTARGVLHRGWMTAARIAQGRSDALFLEECIRGEKAAMRDYEAALHRALTVLPPELASVLSEQYRSIRESFAELILTASNKHAHPTYEIRTATTPPETILTKRMHTKLGGLPVEMAATLRTIGECVHARGVPFAVFHNEPFRPNDVDVEMGATIPADLPVTPADGLVRRQLPGGTIAYTLHVGSYESISAAYEAIFAWLRENGRRVAGPAREIYWVGPDDTNRPQDFRTEIEIPIAE